MLRPRPSLGKKAAGEALWRFALALYARPGVAAALLALQDRAARDIDLMLFLLWLGAVRGRGIDAAGLAAAAAAALPLNRGAVRPLRRMRRQLKTEADRDLQALRRRVAGLEVAAERRVLHRLADLAGTRGADAGFRLELAKANLAVYLGEDAGSPEAGVVRQAVAALVRRG